MSDLENTAPQDMVHSKVKSAEATKKPIVLSLQRYEKLVATATQADRVRAQKDAEEEQKYRELMKEGNDKLVAQFEGNIIRTADPKVLFVKNVKEQTLQEVRDSYAQCMENDEKIRQEKVAKAQQMMEKLKPGPRELQSAAIHSEVLRARKVQCAIKAEFERAKIKQECVDRIACINQNNAMIKDAQERMNEHQERTNEYKKELLNTISENAKLRSDARKQSLQEQRAAREHCDLEIQFQIERERMAMEKKRTELRKNALEAMKMVEQRRLRECMVEEAENRLCCVYNTGKRTLDNAKTARETESKAIKQGQREATAEELGNKLKESQPNENELRRDICHMQIRFTEAEKEKVLKDKAAKQARIEAHIKEVREQKEMKLRANEVKRFDMAQRFKNEEINCLFNENVKQDKIKKAKALRAQLNSQVEEKRLALQAQRDASQCYYNNNYDKENRYFFNYANNLIEDAHKKNRPLYPFERVVKQYKRDQMVDCERFIPRHMQSSINVGLDKPPQYNVAPEFGGNKYGMIPLMPSASRAKPLTNDQEMMKIHCKNIDKLLAGDMKNNNFHKSDCQNDCFKPNEKYKPKDAISCSDLLSSPSNKLRYSKDELKKLNKFADPSMY